MLTRIDKQKSDLVNLHSELKSILGKMKKQDIETLIIDQNITSCVFSDKTSLSFKSPNLNFSIPANNNKGENSVFTMSSSDNTTLLQNEIRVPTRDGIIIDKPLSVPQITSSINDSQPSKDSDPKSIPSTSELVLQSEKILRQNNLVNSNKMQQNSTYLSELHNPNNGIGHSEAISSQSLILPSSRSFQPIQYQHSNSLVNTQNNHSNSEISINNRSSSNPITDNSRVPRRRGRPRKSSYSTTTRPLFPPSSTTITSQSLASKDSSNLAKLNQLCNTHIAIAHFTMNNETKPSFNMETYRMSLLEALLTEPQSIISFREIQFPTTQRKFEFPHLVISELINQYRKDLLPQFQTVLLKLVEFYNKPKLIFTEYPFKDYKPEEEIQTLMTILEQSLFGADSSLQYFEPLQLLQKIGLMTFEGQNYLLRRLGSLLVLSEKDLTLKRRINFNYNSSIQQKLIKIGVNIYRLLYNLPENNLLTLDMIHPEIFENIGWIPVWRSLICWDLENNYE